MATKSPDDEEFITLELENSSSSTVKEIFLSVTDIYDWDLPSILSSRIVRIRAHRHRLMESSRYFDALLSGSYSESSKNFISIQWDLESFITILQFIYGYPVEFTLTNFPSLLENMLNLLESSPLISEMDLSVDCSPVMPLKASILSSVTDGYQQLSGKLHVFNGRPALSKLTKLSLEGRTELRDSDLVNISLLANLLSHINLKGCTSLTDMGISKAVFKFKQLSSIIAADTYFGDLSISCLCSGFPSFDCFTGTKCDPKHLKPLAFTLQLLDVGGCRSISQSSLVHLLEHAPFLKELGLRDTVLGDDALYHFVGCSLEALDICETMVSRNGLAYIIRRNPKLIVLKAKGCRQLSSSDGRLRSVGCMPKYDFVGSTTDGDNPDHALSRVFTWEELRLGWGFYPSSLKILEPSIQMLKAINVGVGAQLGELAVASLPKLCPLLESVSLCFQVISDSAVRNILRSLKNLQDCGNMTLDGISSLMDCKAVEDLLLRHNGPGIPRNFIIDAASKLPLLRKLALDLCDARDGGFDSPSATGRFFLRTVTIARCRSERCAIVLPNVAGQKHTMHKESIVLEWNSEELRTYIVEERV
ncbi:BTB/POZ domain-containing protein [Nymphaea thermarum]|nr:BTB/POZ domain-containing protein [Nymphaea thermarum]